MLKRNLFWFIAFLGCPLGILAQPTFRNYDAIDYNEETYTTDYNTLRFKDVKIIVTEIFNKKYFENKRLYCRAWVYVYKNEKVTDSVYFDNMNAFGGCAGLYWKKIQAANFFVMSKFGDYDGRVLVIDSSGIIYNMPGGKYFLTRDGRYIFSTYDSDKNGLVVFDTRTKKVVFLDDSLQTPINQWYFQGGKYFSIDEEAIEEEEGSLDKGGIAPLLQFTIATFDFAHRTLKSEKLPFENLREENKIKMFPEIKSVSECQCK